MDKNKQNNLNSASETVSEGEFDGGDTIVAPSTAPGVCAVAILRISGSRAKQILAQVFSPVPSAPNRLCYGKIRLGDISDGAMAVYFDAPRSFTGEDMAEMHVHGGNFVVREAVAACVRFGARIALPGEFSRRALLNGKTTLTASEGMIEMINAESLSAARVAAALQKNALGRSIGAEQDILVDILAAIEAGLDYPEENLEEAAANAVLPQIEALIGRLRLLLSTAGSGRLVRGGINVVICGAPNVGKSSLLNALLGFERAIVSKTAGTTRDVVGENVVFRDIKINFSDTAGLRESGGKTEQIGIERAANAVADADILLFVRDAKRAVSASVDAVPDAVANAGAPVITVFNKIDKLTALQRERLQKIAGSDAILCCATTGEGVEQIKLRIHGEFSLGKVLDTTEVLVGERHADCLSRAVDALEHARDCCRENAPELCAAELCAANAALGELSGRGTTDEVIDRIYAKFCLGK